MQLTGVEHLDWTLTHWESIRRDRCMPARSDLDPTEFRPEILPHLILVEVLEGPRFRNRLCGTAHVQAAGWDQTGTYLDELPERGGYRDYLIGIYELVTEEKAPVFTQSSYLWNENVRRSTQRLMVPFSNDGETVSHVLSAQVFDFDSGDDETKINLTGFSEYSETRRLVMRG